MKKNELKTLITNPIEETSLNLFSGRKNELEEIEFLLTSFNIVIIEGLNGIGKTSLGNYYRFSKNTYITPKEISTDPTWSAKDFLHEVLKSLIISLSQKDKILDPTFLRPLLKRYSYLMDKTFRLEVLGNSAEVEKQESIEQVITVQGLTSDLDSLSKAIETAGFEVLIQLNNLDLGKGFSKEQMAAFFGVNRNAFQIPSVKWILTGSIGLRDFFHHNLEKFAGVLIDPIVLEPLEKKQMLEAISKRGLDIFAKEHLEYLIKDGDLRSIFKRLLYIKNKGESKTLLEFKQLNSKEIELVEALGLQQLASKELAKSLGISVPAIGNRIRELVLKKVLSQVTLPKQSEYRLSFEAYHSLYIKKIKIEDIK